MDSKKHDVDAVGKAYVESHLVWMLRQRFLVSQLKRDKEYHERMARIVARQLKVEDDFLKANDERFKAWCKEEGVESDIEL